MQNDRGEGKYMYDPKKNSELSKSDVGVSATEPLPEGTLSSGELDIFDSSYPTLADPGNAFVIRGTILHMCYGSVSGVVKIPIGVTQIFKDSARSWAFENCYLISSLIMPDTVLELEDGTFCSCAGLKRLRLSDKLTKIPRRMCNGCGELEEICVPESVTDIGAEAFYDCRGLKKVTLPKSLRKIEDNAFCNCIKLETIDIPANVERIGKKCFCGCSKLTSVTISKSVKTIGFNAFEGCTGLSKVVLPLRFMMKKSILGIPSSAKIIYKNV